MNSEAFSIKTFSHVTFPLRNPLVMPDPYVKN